MNTKILNLITSTHKKINIYDENNILVGQLSKPIACSLFEYIKLYCVYNKSSEYSIVLPFENSICNFLITYVAGLFEDNCRAINYTIPSQQKMNMYRNIVDLFDYLQADEIIVDSFFQKIDIPYVTYLLYLHEFVHEINLTYVKKLLEIIKLAIDGDVFWINLFNTQIIDLYSKKHLHGAYSIYKFTHSMDYIINSQIIDQKDKYILLHYILKKIPKYKFSKKMFENIIHECAMLNIPFEFDDIVVNINDLPDISNKYSIFDKNNQLCKIIFDDIHIDLYICELHQVEEQPRKYSYNIDKINGGLPHWISNFKIGIKMMNHERKITVKELTKKDKEFIIMSDAYLSDSNADELDRYHFEIMYINLNECD